MSSVQSISFPTLFGQLHENVDKIVNRTERLDVLIPQTQKKIEQMLKVQNFEPIVDALHEMELQLKYLKSAIVVRGRDGVSKGLQAIECACWDVLIASRGRPTQSPSNLRFNMTNMINSNDTSAVSELISRNRYSVNFQMDRQNMTILQCASKTGDIAKVFFMLQHGADPDFAFPQDISFFSDQNNKLPPLFSACVGYAQTRSEKNEKIVKMLLQAKANVDLLDDKKELYLPKLMNYRCHLKEEPKLFEVAATLLSRLTSNPEIFNCEDGFGRNLMELACINKNRPVVNFLTTKNAIVNLRAISELARPQRPGMPQWAMNVNITAAEVLKKNRAVQIAPLDQVLSEVDGLKSNAIDVLNLIRDFVQ